MTIRNPAPSFGDLLKVWRERRRMSQLKLAVEAEISQRHLSFVESGRSQPSRDMVLRLCDYLDVPLRDQNALLLAAGYAPAFAERSLDDPDLAPARAAIDLILKGHMPYPALAVDRCWTMVAANDAVGGLLAGVAAHLLEPPVNVLRLSLHPGGLSRRILTGGSSSDLSWIAARKIGTAELPSTIFQWRSTAMAGFGSCAFNTA